MGFFDVPRKVAPTSEGQVELPILYSEASMVQALFGRDYGLVASQLRGSGLVPIRLPRNRALVAVSFFEYRQSSIGPYNEMALAVVVDNPVGSYSRVPLIDVLRQPRQRKTGIHILELPVSTKIACAAGREIWGFPKFVADIPFSLGQSGFDCSVLNPETQAPVITLSGPRRRGAWFPPVQMRLISRHRVFLETIIDVRGLTRTSRGHQTLLQVLDQSHHLGQSCRDLGLDGAQPLVVQTTDRFRSRLHQGQRITS